MEELRSTEVLDKEILEDARRKAQRILKAADDAAVQAAATWEKKTKAVIAKAKKRYATKLEENRNEIMARFPLDKWRCRLAQIETFLNTAMDDYIAGLSRDRLLSILEKELAIRIQYCPEIALAPFTVYARGLEKDELEGLLKRLVPRQTWTIGEEPDLRTVPGRFPAVVLDSEKLRITASVDGAALTLLKDKRFELATALLGEAALADPIRQEVPHG
ncbi:MAG: ATPase [Spirochaetaceae bacterium]|jgi:vacuolar-type H+-ATPase subunit E/Vma4|nr:ATPase [Spirochaetaceae bacterium]